MRTQTDKNHARHLTREAPRDFIAIDGEGVTDPATGVHRYVLISCGDKHLAADGAHLEFAEILNFLWSCFEDDPRAIYVGFYLKYDWGQWLRTLPRDRADALLSPAGIARRKYKSPKAGLHPRLFPVTYAGWDFDYLYGKRFKFRPAGEPPKNAPTKLVSINPETGMRKWLWMYVNDAGSYFQTSFLKAIDPTGNPNAVVSKEEYDLIAAGKARRQSAEYDPAMIEYNQLECRALARLMQQLEVGMRHDGLKANRDQWHGPGQLAQLWLRQIKAPRGDQLRDAIPEAVRLAARASYTAGWFEQFWHGPVPGKAFSYDINSAYPYVMAKLPCLLHGEWSHHVERAKGERSGGMVLTWAQKDALGDGLAFVYARLEGKHPVVGAMRHRLPSRAILRPQMTEGWFVESELKAALDASFVEKVRLFERWSFAPHCACPPPLAPIADLYAGRIAIGKSTPAGKTRKLIYNSGAGKYQQSIGIPAFGNPVYATLIPAGCRSIITRAIASHPNGAHDLLQVATDSVTFRSPHPGLELDKEKLGAWTESQHHKLSLLMNGIYWDDESRRRIAAGDAPVFKSRGIAARDLADKIAELDKAWQNFSRQGWPTLRLPVHFQVISPKQALARGNWELCGTTINSDNPATWPDPTKKPERVVNSNPGLHRLTRGPGRSRPHRRPPELVSLPYDGTFGDELRDEIDDEFGDHPDGPIGDMLAEAMLDN